MKQVLALAALALALAVWALLAWPSASVEVTSQAVLATVLGGNLALCLGVWYWVRPRSGAVKAMPFFALLTAAMLLDKLPRLLWPAADGAHTAGWIASMTVLAGLSLVQVRRIVIEIRCRRSLLSHRARPVK